VAYAHLVARLRGKQLAEQQVTPEGLWRTTWQGEGGSVTVLFAAEQGQLLTHDLPAEARVEDMFGRSLPVEGAVEVTWDPIFVVSGG
jgi:hypothetical protein